MTRKNFLALLATPLFPIKGALSAPMAPRENPFAGITHFLRPYCQVTILEDGTKLYESRVREIPIEHHPEYKRFIASQS